MPSTVSPHRRLFLLLMHSVSFSLRVLKPKYATFLLEMPFVAPQYGRFWPWCLAFLMTDRVREWGAGSGLNADTDIIHPVYYLNVDKLHIVAFKTKLSFSLNLLISCKLLEHICVRRLVFMNSVYFKGQFSQITREDVEPFFHLPGL